MQLIRGGVSYLLVLLLLAGAGCSKSARKGRWLSRANQEFDAGRYDAAEIDYLKVLQLPPPEPLALVRLGAIYFAENNRGRALGYLEQAAKAAPNDAETRSRLGRTYLWFHQLDQAREQALLALKEKPTDPEAIVLLAETSGTREQLEQTEQWLDQAAGKADSPGLHLGRAVIGLARGDVAGGEAEYQLALALDSKSVDALMGLANVYLLRGDQKQAEQVLKRAAELAPVRSYARIRYAEFQLNNGAGQAAIAAVQNIVGQAPDYLPASIFLAKAALADGKNAEAMNLLKTVLARDPHSYEALLLSGNLLLATGDPTNAVAQYERLVKTYGPGAQPEYRLALAQFASGQNAKASASLDRAIAADTNFVDAQVLRAKLDLREGKAAAVLATMGRLARLRPGVPEVQLLRAEANLVNGQPDTAVALYRRMLESFPRNAEVPLRLGMLLASQGKVAEAREAFAHALELSPGWLPPVEQLIELDILAKQFPAALNRAQTLVTANPQDARGVLLVAKVYAARALLAVSAAQSAAAAQPPHTNSNAVIAEDLRAAETAARKAIELDSTFSSAYELLAKLYVWSGRPQDAIAQLSALVARTNDVPALLQIAAIQTQLRNDKAAAAAYEKALATAPDAFEALNNLAVLCAERLGQLGRALDLAQRAQQVQPQNPCAADTLGWVFCLRGDYPRALGLLQSAAAGLPQELEVQYHIGTAHYFLGNEDQARAALARAAQATGDPAWKTQITNCLDILSIDPATPDPGLVSRLQQRLQVVPNDPVARVRLAAIRQREGKYQEAAADLEQALKNNPRQAGILLNLAKLYDSYLKDPQRALVTARLAHEAAPDDPRVSHLLGRLAFANKDFPAAANLLEETARALPADPDVLYDLAWSRYSLGQVNQAETAMKSVAAANATPKSKLAARFLEFTAAARVPEQAQALAERAQAVLSSEPGYVPALMVLALGQEQTGNFTTAADCYDRILNVFSDFAPAKRNLALLCSERLNQDARAYELASKARPAFPEDSRLSKVLGIGCFKRGEYARATQLLEESARTRGQDAELLCYLGMAYCQARQPVQGKETLQRALTLSPPAPLADQVKRALNQL